MNKKAVVIHSGGMDSSLCLAVARRDFLPQELLSISFSYGQRHSNELKAATKICQEWGIDQVVLDINCLQTITSNSLVDIHQPITHVDGQEPNTLVVGRNGLMVRLGAIHANNLGASCIYTGVIEVEGANSGYRDCSRAYMDKMQDILRIDFSDAIFEIRTPLVKMTKKETMMLGYELGVLDFLLETTITCYEGVALQGCRRCPACKLRNQGLRQFIAENPDFHPPFQP
ncbi:MAG: 7-cyano-7-deazaguanine synthase QueC [Chlamydiota bacterium]